MKAIVLTAPGGVENLELQEIAMPTIHQNEVLVKVKSFALNPVDIKTRQGKAMYGHISKDTPVILGWDISGVVAVVGNTVTKFKEGDEVFGMVNFPGHGKAYAEYVASPEDHLATKPVEITHAEAAAGTLAALTAWQVLVHQANIQAGQRVLIQAAAGGVGNFAVQIAKHLGAVVLGTASVANADFLDEIGIDEHIDYKREDYTQDIEQVDFVLDSLGTESVAKALNIIKEGGQLISIVGGANEENKSKAAEKNIKADNYLVHSSAEDMAQLAELYKTGKIKIHVSQEFSINKIAEAHQQIETGRTRGKIVVNLEDGA